MKKRKPKKPKFESDILVGKYQLGWRSVEFYVMPYENGGWFQAVPGDGRDSQMHIGLYYERWEDVLEVLLHEAHEFNMSDLNCAYRPNNVYADNCSDGVYFMMDHNQHTEACARSAYFMSSVIEPLRKWWDKVRKEAE